MDGKQEKPTAGMAAYGEYLNYIDGDDWDELHPLTQEMWDRIAIAGSAPNLSTIEAQAKTIEAMRAAIDQALDDMANDGHCVCPAAKEQLKSALTLAHTEEK